MIPRYFKNLIGKSTNNKHAITNPIKLIRLLK